MTAKGVIIQIKEKYIEKCIIQQNWSSNIRDCVPSNIEKYNQEHRLLTETDYDNRFSIYKLFLSDDIIDFIVCKNKFYKKCETQASSSIFRKHK